MKAGNYHIIPSAEEYHERLMQLEKGIVQGKQIQLEIVKEHFFSRARVFKNIFSCIALTRDEQVIGSAIAAKTAISVNGECFKAGIGFDAKVHPAWRGRGVGRMMAKELYKQFFIPAGLTKNFMTAKLSNAPILKLVTRTVSKTWLYDFIYLTIPSSSRFQENTPQHHSAHQFKIQLMGSDEMDPGHYRLFENGLGLFYTCQLYRLRLKKIGWLYKSGIAALKKLNKSKYAALPKENELLSFATLYNHTPENINGINKVLEQLQKEGIGQLLVCCRKNDAVHKALSKIAIHKYGYYLVSDFRLNNDDQVTIDVRCL